MRPSHLPEVSRELESPLRNWVGFWFGGLDQQPESIGDTIVGKSMRSLSELTWSNPDTMRTSRGRLQRTNLLGNLYQQ